MLYFAYGSNLFPARLQARTPSAKVIDTGFVRGHVLRWHKIGDDESGKCDMYFTGHAEDVVYGAIYEIDPIEKFTLDRIEGVGEGYEVLRDFQVHTPAGQVEAFSYRVMSNWIDPDIKPFEWYKQFVLRGAQYHGFPAAYIDAIAATPAKADPDTARAAANAAILAKS